MYKATKDAPDYFRICGINYIQSLPIVWVILPARGLKVGNPVEIKKASCLGCFNINNH